MTDKFIIGLTKGSTFPLKLSQPTKQTYLSISNQTPAQYECLLIKQGEKKESTLCQGIVLPCFHLDTD